MTRQPPTMSPQPPRSRVAQRAATAGMKSWRSRLWHEVGLAVATPSRLRLVVVGGICGLSLLAMWGHLFKLQVIGLPQVQAVLQARSLPNAPVLGQRRAIIDRNGHVLAIDQTTYTLYAHPKLFKVKPFEVATQLAPILERSVRDLYSELQTADSGIRLADFLSQSDMAAVQRLRLDGLELNKHPARLYPNNDLAADVVGYVDFDGHGQAGIELTYQSRLLMESPESDPPPDSPSGAGLQPVAESPNQLETGAIGENAAPETTAESSQTESSQTKLGETDRSIATNHQNTNKPGVKAGADQPSAESPAGEAEASALSANLSSDRPTARSLSELQFAARTRDRDDLSLQLTIDLRLQRTARQLLSETIATYKAKRGVVMVMDARDGAILASVSHPSYDPNRYFEASPDRFKNWALSDLYEPGSTFKPINLAIALESGSIQPDDRFDDPGQIVVSDWPISNADFEWSGGRGNVSVTEILRDSSNVGMVHIMQRMPATDYHDWLTRLQVDQPTGIDLPFEGQSQLKSREIFASTPIEPATAAFGQGLAITPIQLLKLHGILASGGQIVTPHIVRGLVDSQGQMVWTPDFQPPQRVLSRETTQTVIGMMEAVVREGTGRKAQVTGYRIAGKTGTSQKIDPNGGYSDSALITSFVGILPVEDPRYVVVAVIDEPQTGRSGGIVAAPIVRQMIEHLIAIEHIPPSTATSTTNADRSTNRPSPTPSPPTR